MQTFPRKTSRDRPDRSRRAGPPRSGAEATRLVDGAATTGLCVGLAALLRVWPAGPIPAGAILTGLLASAGYLWLAVAITEDAADGDPRRATGWDVSAWNVTAWDVALALLAASVAVQATVPLGA